jgi:serine phosphatase RsbU (regulator of sigma subunit)
MKYFFIIFLALLSKLLFGYIALPDSVLKELNKQKNDTLKCEYLLKLAERTKGNNPRFSFDIASGALFYAEQSNYVQGMVKSYNLLGSIKCDIGDFVAAIDYHSKAYERAKFLKDDLLLAETFNYMGNLSYAQGKYTKAIEYYKQSLDYSNKANSKNQTLNNLYRLGLIYETLDNLNDAYRCYKKSLLIEEELKNKEGIFFSLMGIASVSQKRQNYYQAFVLYNKALSIAQELNILAYQSLVYSKLGDLSKIQKKYVDALKYYSISLKIADSLDYYKDKKNCYYNLAFTNEKLQFYKEAYHYLTQYVELNNKIYDADVAEQIARLQMKFDIKSKEKEIEQLKFQEEQRTRERNFLFVGASLLLIILILLVILFRTRQKNAKILKQQYIELKSKKEELDNALEQLNILNSELKKSNEQITNSLIYAASIQETILPFEYNFKEIFNNCFIFNQPKNIVSGDFAWILKKQNIIYCAIADCTGHGLAGALVSIKGYNLLNYALNNLTNPLPSEILSWIDKHWYSSNLSNSRFNDDSMDLALLKINTITSEIEYATANQKFVIIDNNSKPNIYENSIYCIGGLLENDTSKYFTTDKIKINSGDTMYLFTDGFSDQFGENNQKLMFNSFIEHLRSLAKYDINKQKTIIQDFFNSWKGKNEQTDDVLVVGIKF